MTEELATINRKQCNHLNVARTKRDLLDCNFRSEIGRVRGQISVRLLAAVVNAVKEGRVTEGALLAFLREGDLETNLASGADVVEFEKFAFEKYLQEKAKPKLKERSFYSETTQVQRLVRTLNNIPLHEIRPPHGVLHKKTLLELGRVNNTIRKDLFCLSRIIDYGIECGLLRGNPMPEVTGLPSTNRSAVWLRSRDIVSLLWAADRRTRSLILFMILTGARINEALEFKVTDIDWQRRIIHMPTEKRRGKSVGMRTKMRTLKIDSLGSRFIRLLKIMKPHPTTGYFFFLDSNGQHMHYNYAEDLIGGAVKKAKLQHLIPAEVMASGGIDHVIPHDFRRTFTRHRVIVGVSFNQLRAELGQTHSASIQSYLDESENHDPAESIFFERPRKPHHHEADVSSAALPQTTTTPIVLTPPPPLPILH